MSTGHYRAYVILRHYNRQVSDLMASAGLGLTGISVEEPCVVDYKRGEVVDVPRVMRAFDALVAASEAQQTEVKVFGYEVLKVEFVPDAPESKDNWLEEALAEKESRA